MYEDKDDEIDENYGDDSILYELLEYYVRKQEPEYPRCKNETAGILPATGTLKNALKYLNNRYSLAELISIEIGLTLPWKFAVGDKGSLLAILQENLIEIRKSKDEYSSVVGKASVPKDAFPQWRRIAWSPDCSLLVLASSNGLLSFYNSLGNNVFNITPKSVAQNPNVLEAGDSVASLIFLKSRVKSLKWSYELLVTNYSGLLKSYYVSATDAFEESHEFSFGSFYRNGVTAVVHNQKHNLLFLAGGNVTQTLNTKSSEAGLTSWRILNDYPFYKLTSTDDQTETKTARFSIWNYLPSLRHRVESLVFKTSISPSGDLLACLHTDGSITVWNLPSLRLHRKWTPNEQPDSGVENPLVLDKLRKPPHGLSEFHPIDVNWWSDHSVIIARYCGSVSVCSIKDLRNLLGASPEFLNGQPQISELCPDRGFLSLDCETVLMSKKRSRDSTSEGQNSESLSESEMEDEDADNSRVLKYAGSLFQGALYSITDLEKFQPKRKKAKLVHRTYRILGLKSTTPMELYSRKINIEEYGEALALAKTYNLDTDLVYQTQWRKSEFSLNAIKDHLSKVSKRSWVLNECVTRVPDTIESCRELLNFGLRGANLETLLAIGVEDDGKFTPDYIDDEDNDDFDETNRDLKKIQKENQILDELNVDDLSEEQKELLKYRRKLLDHIDKLQTYEIILETPSMYDKNFYQEFRSFSALENAVRFAKDSNCRAVAIMFTYHSSKILPHWLAVISYFPETLKPSDYEKLLPECDSDGRLFLPDQRELRRKDWSEKSEFDGALESSEDDGTEIIYDHDQSLRVYRNVPLTQELLQKWYKSRAYQIERNSYMVDNALSLIRIAKSRNIFGLDQFLFELETLDDLIYKVNVEDMSLARLEKLSDLDKLKLLMSKSEETGFVEDLKDLAIPFVRRREKLIKPGEIQSRRLLHDYVMFVSEEDLTKGVSFFAYLKETRNTEIITNTEEVTRLALDCLYSCKGFNMYDQAKSIFECIPVDDDRVEESRSLVEELEHELECLRVLSNYNVKTTLSFIKQNKSKPDTVKMLLTQMARSVNSSPPNEKLWPQLLNDILKIHETTFSCLDIEVCLEICVSARLTSGDKTTIQNCSGSIETKRTEKSLLKVPYEKAVELILQASTEYFNSSKSLTDGSMELAKACLYLIEDENAEIKEEYELINSLQILNEFGVNFLPLQVRLSQDRIKLIESCLRNQTDAYKNTQRLLNLADYLRIEKYNVRNRHAKVLELVAEKAYEAKDYEACGSLCARLMDHRSASGWRIVYDLGNDDNYDNVKFRRKCLSFAMNCGPPDLLETLLRRLHLLEIRILHEELSEILPAEVSENLVDSEDEFTDAMTTPQIESKEFVPNIIGTSTEIVRNSAELVKNSTYSLLKNVGNRSFWRNTLSLNFGGDKFEPIGGEEEVLKLYGPESSAQSFSCFYEDLHPDCRIGKIDANYTKYSKPDFNNAKFKLCQNLVRVTLLEECASYGAEISSIDHLFVECARHVFSEDCLLGLSYLMSLKCYDADLVKSAFDDIADSKLRIQLAAYLYALELHAKLNPEEIGHYYDPLQLTMKMAKAAESVEDCPIAAGLAHWASIMFGAEKNAASNAEGNRTREAKSGDSPILMPDESKGSGKSTFDKFSAEATSFESTNDEGTGWDDDWGDFSEQSDEAGEKLKEDFEVRESEASDSFGSEEERFEMFERLLSEASDKEGYLRAKERLCSWPKFVNPQFVRVGENPALRLILVAAIHGAEFDEGFDSERLLECKEILNGDVVAEEVLTEFLNDSKNGLDLELRIFLRLCSGYKSLQEEAVRMLKERYEEVKLSSPILHELFFKDLTGSFHPNHAVYKKILHEMVDNFYLIDIKENLTKLINVLIEQRYLPHASALRNIVGSVPRSLQTFDNGLEGSAWK